MTSEMHRWRSGRTPSLHSEFRRWVLRGASSSLEYEELHSDHGFYEAQVASMNMKRVITMLFTLNLRYKIIGICNWWFRSCCKEARRPAWQK
ncbi:uncharacterized protein [Aegilops tauschii subsp. strangulata]|uniref:uncharacterized protein isoform X2 n=1 Tax=Aegilops tauschii subsp. strangulata TaxID=200361 RepID=UPI001E1CA7E4|nr:uncharacterized protein LOC109737332 isoform X3 [Aegilops tauschii subsp. strangulata]